MPASAQMAMKRSFPTDFDELSKLVLRYKSNSLTIGYLYTARVQQLLKAIPAAGHLGQ